MAKSYKENDKKMKKEGSGRDDPKKNGGTKPKKRKGC